LIFLTIFLFKDVILNNEPTQTPQDELNNNDQPDDQSSTDTPDSDETVADTDPITNTDPETNPEPVNEPEPTEETEPETEPEQPDYSNIWSLILVNGTHLLPEDFAIETEVVQGKYEMDKRAAEYAKQMIEAAKSDGIDLLLCSAYRSVETQERLYNKQIEQQKNNGLSEEEAIAVAGTIVAKPGTSEHHTGLALDIVTPEYQNLNSGYAKTDAFKWLNEHAQEYGFILRYPEDKQDITKIIYEPWHYRYVGTEYSVEIKEKGICLEEFLGLTD
jgi:D-alanyl-D-alanine carboxypeptidase